MKAIKKVYQPGDLYIGLHSNAVSRHGGWQTRASGSRIIYYKSKLGRVAQGSKDVAEHIYPNWPHRTGAQTRDPFGKNLYMLRKAPGPALIIEVGFHDHPLDVQWMASGGFNAIANHIASRLQWY
jgi:N-acetylmuramoyl-L-alanine amidase